MAVDQLPSSLSAKRRPFSFSFIFVQTGSSQTVRDECGILTGCSLSHSSIFLFSLRNASGQTAADLAHAHGFLSCSHLIADDHKLQLQASGLCNNGEEKGDPPCCQALLSRKRLLSAVDSGHAKKTRTAESESLFLTDSLFLTLYISNCLYLCHCLLLQMCWCRCTAAAMRGRRTWTWSLDRTSVQVGQEYS